MDRHEAGYVLVVDDDADVRTMIERVLGRAGFRVLTAQDGEAALQILRGEQRIDVVLTDLQMPRMSGVALLRSIRELDQDVPVIVLTGNASLESAIAVVEHGGFRYLEKPIENERLQEMVRAASAMHRLALLKREALELAATGGLLAEDRAELEATFERALDGLWIAFQPIVEWPTQSIFGYEALVRSSEESLAKPAQLFEAAERLNRFVQIGRLVRNAVAESVPLAPKQPLIFVNLNAAELADDDLYSPTALLSAHAERVVLEITERSSLHKIDALRERIAELRQLGFRIAVDDLGAGYAGLSSFTQLEPDIVKLDMSLVRDIDNSRRKASLVHSMLTVCQRDLGVQVVCEGIETVQERDKLERLGAKLLQGYLFGRPERVFQRERATQQQSGSRPRLGTTNDGTDG